MCYRLPLHSTHAMIEVYDLPLGAKSCMFGTIFADDGFGNFLPVNAAAFLEFYVSAHEPV